MSITTEPWKSWNSVQTDDCGAKGMLGLMFWLCLYTGLCMALGALIGVWFAVAMSKR